MGSNKLYLRESVAKQAYACASCDSIIRKYSRYYRFDPHPFARMRGEAETKHYCIACVEGREVVARFIHRLPPHLVDSRQLRLDFKDDLIVRPAYVFLVSATRQLISQIEQDYSAIYRLEPGQFEDLIRDRFEQMGFTTEKVGHTFRKDGGIDLLFWPRSGGAWPFLGAAQLKHHRKATTTTPVQDIREFRGAIGGLPIDIGVVVTNTTFTPDAEWLAQNRSPILRLRDMRSLRRWVAGNFIDDADWRELPQEIELCPGVKIDLSKRLLRRNEAPN